MPGSSPRLCFQPRAKRVLRRIHDSRRAIHGSGPEVGQAGLRSDIAEPTGWSRLSPGWRGDWPRMASSGGCSTCGDRSLGRCGSSPAVGVGRNGLRHPGALLFSRAHASLHRGINEGRGFAGGGCRSRPQSAPCRPRFGAATGSGDHG